jgi:hypothetical protein
LLSDKSKLTRDPVTGKVSWTPDQLKSFEILKATLLRDAILTHPDFTQSFLIDTDTCEHDMDAVISQKVGGQNAASDIRKSIIDPNKAHIHYLGT